MELDQAAHAAAERVMSIGWSRIYVITGDIVPDHRGSALFPETSWWNDGPRYSMVDIYELLSGMSSEREDKWHEWRARHSDDGAKDRSHV